MQSGKRIDPYRTPYHHEDTLDDSHIDMQIKE